MAATRNIHSILVVNPEGKTQLARPRHRWEDNIKEIGWGGMDWIHLAQNRGK
jgi:hypothetical protein